MGKGLQIGNIFQGLIIESITPTGVNFTAGYEGYNETSFAQLTPIPLTAAILEECGFVNIGSDTLGGWFIYRNRGVDLLVGEGGFHFYHGRSIRFLFHVHELQNLYYFLIDEELEIHATQNI